MASNGVFLASALFLVAFSCCSMASASIIEHTFHVENLTISRLCKEQTITVINGSLPGPTLRVREGDTLVVHVINQSPYNITIHWHGIFQLLSAWADGPSMITQCPIRPGHSYTYRFNVTQQEGTLWWHSHFSTLRATVYGALIIRPRSGHRYPFPKPHKEVPILLGEWWNGNVVDIENEAFAVGGAPNNSDAYTINGLPGDLYPCSKNQMYELKVVKGKRYLLRIINAALNNQLFFKIANHKLTVVAVDASYTKPYVTDVIITGPGQTVDAILVADQLVGSYHMAARAYASAAGVAFDNTTTRGLIVYAGSGNGGLDARPTPVRLPAFNDTPTVHRFLTEIKGLVGGPHWVPVPRHVDEKMHVTIGLGLETCGGVNATCQGPFGQRLSASMNNYSFQKPTSISMLQAFYFNRHDIYTGDFPDRTPKVFDYTNGSNSFDTSLVFTRPKSTSVKILRFNSTVEMVLQNTALIGVENHPMHIHGINFHVLGSGFGNYDPHRDVKRLNFFNPQIRNTVGVPVGGWTVIRFTANNPGVWFMHCHLDVHLRWGLATAFVVQNGPTESTRLPPPPADLPQC